MDPLLAERRLLVLGALGVPVEARPRLFQRAMGGIFEMILTKSGRSRAAGQEGHCHIWQVKALERSANDPLTH